MSQIKITVPEDLGGKLKVLPEDTYEAAIQDIYYGISKAKQPKFTVKWVIQSEYSGTHGKDYESTIGENVLESYSLQPNAIWKLNDLFITITGNRIPHADYTPEEFTDMVKEHLIGSECLVDVATEDQSGEERSVVRNVVAKPSKGKKKK